MCGRYVRKGESKKVAETLGVKDGEENWTESGFYKWRRCDWIWFEV